MTIVRTRDLEFGNWYTKWPGGTKSFKLLERPHFDPAASRYELFVETEEGKSFHILCEDRQFKLKEGTSEMTLLQIKGTEKYGFQLAINSSGKAVVEVKGTGEILTVDPNLLEEVIPYSVDVKFIGADSTRTYSYWAKEGSLKLGDIVFSPSNNQFVVVVKVNSKSRAANKFLSGVVMTQGHTIGE
jgi:hypothetical protein